MTVVVCLHGFTQSPDSFAALHSELPQYLPTLTPALAGHAGTPASESFASEVDRLRRLIVQHGARPAHLLGYSLGGRLALGLLLSAPALFRSATLISCSAGLESEPERAARRQHDSGWRDLLESKGLDAFGARWQAQALFASQSRLPEAVLSTQRRTRRGHDAQALAAALACLGLAEMPNLWPRLGEIELPISVLAGALDPKFVAIGRRLAAALPRAHFDVIAGAGHNLLLEAPRDVARAIARALQPSSSQEARS